jgi:glycine hydroxymethyltransferase
MIAAKAVAFKEALSPSYRAYQQQVVNNAQALARGFLQRNFKLVSGGTDNHLMLMNLTETPVSGKDLEQALGLAGITVNKNTVPYEKRSPFVTSGVRFGTPALTTRGMGGDEMDQIAELVRQVFDHIHDEPYLRKLAHQVQSLAERFPLYKGW